MGQVILKIRIAKVNHAWPVGIYGTSTFKNKNKNTLYVGQVLLKNKNTKKVFLASGNMWDR